MEKKLVYLFSDNADYYNIVFTDLSGITAWIEADCEGVSEHDLCEFEFTIQPRLMTQEEIDNLPEAD